MRVVTAKDKERINKLARKLEQQCPYFSWADLAQKAGWSATTVRRHFDKDWYPGKYYQDPMIVAAVSKDLEYPGIYMLAQRIIEEDGRILNLIKVGKSKNIRQRLSSYRTANPFAKCIDTKELFEEDLDEYEKAYHYLLGRDNVRYGSTEWFVCDEAQYNRWIKQGLGNI